MHFSAGSSLFPQVQSTHKSQQAWVKALCFPAWSFKLHPSPTREKHPSPAGWETPHAKVRAKAGACAERPLCGAKLSRRRSRWG